MNYTQKVTFAKNILKQTIIKHDRNALFVASSFGKDSIVLIHLAISVLPEIEIISLISDTEFRETYSYIDKIIDEWKINCRKVNFKQKAFIEKNPERCCRDKKVEAMRSIIKDKHCWFSGIRRSEGDTRQKTKSIERSQGIEKVNPLIYFTELDIWRYIATHHLEVNPLYAQGYRSLGCQHCSKQEKSDLENERDGRWGGLTSQGGECGIHTEKLK